jgi:hypothetical protein
MSKWICKCGSINPVLNWVCHNCEADWVVETKAENITTISITKDDQIDSLKAEIEVLAKENANLFLAAKSWEREANIEADHVKELKAKLEIAVDALEQSSCDCCYKQNKKAVEQITGEK